MMVLSAAEKLTQQNHCDMSMVVSNNGSDKLAFLKLPENKVYIWDEKESSAKNIISIANSLRNNVFDELYMAYPSGRREAVIALFSRAKEKKALCDNDRDFLLLRKIYRPKKLKPSDIHDTNANLFLFGMPYQGYVKPVSISNSIKKTYGDFAKGFFDENNLSHNVTIALHPGCKSPGKRWPVENYIELCKSISKKAECKFLIIGGKNEQALKEQTASGIGNNAVISHTSSITQVAALLGRCRLFVGNDSAPMHLASLMDVPVIALWGYSDFHRTSPYGPGNIVIRINLACSPCYKFSNEYINACRYQLKCIDKIPLDVITKITEKYISTLQQDDRKITTEDIRSLDFCSDIQILPQEHGCTVVNLSKN